MAVRAWWASSMPAKASLGGGAPRAASGAGPGGRSVALGEVSPLVMSHRAVWEGARRADRGGRLSRGLGLRLVAVLVGVLLHAPDVGLGLRVGRHAAVALHGARAGVVGRERLRHVAAEGVELLLQVARAGVDVLRRVVDVRAAERRGRAGHQLAEALRGRVAA